MTEGIADIFSSVRSGIKRIIDLINSAEHYYDIFVPGEKQVQRDYRNYSRMLVYPLPEKYPQAEEAQQKLIYFYGEAIRHIRDGTWEMQPKQTVIDTVPSVNPDSQ